MGLLLNTPVVFQLGVRVRLFRRSQPRPFAASDAARTRSPKRPAPGWPTDPASTTGELCPVGGVRPRGVRFPTGRRPPPPSRAIRSRRRASKRSSSPRRLSCVSLVKKAALVRPTSALATSMCLRLRSGAESPSAFDTATWLTASACARSASKPASSGLSETLKTRTGREPTPASAPRSNGSASTHTFTVCALAAHTAAHSELSAECARSARVAAAAHRVPSLGSRAPRAARRVSSESASSAQKHKAHALCWVHGGEARGVGTACFLRRHTLSAQAGWVPLARSGTSVFRRKLCPPGNVHARQGIQGRIFGQPTPNRRIAPCIPWRACTFPGGHVHSLAGMNVFRLRPECIYIQRMPRGALPRGVVGTSRDGPLS
jgi:hypothetical protein